MHELGIAHSLVEIASETAREHGTGRVVRVNLRLGVLAGVVRDALDFCYGIAAAGTPIEGSELRVIELPALVHCAPCDQDFEVPDELSFACPRCGQLSGDLRQGKELEVESIELEDADETEKEPS